jgi:cell division protein FtsB
MKRLNFERLVRYRRFQFALLMWLVVAAAPAVCAEDKNLAEEVRLLREQNARLQKQMQSQGGALDALTQQVKQLESARANGELASGANAAPTGFNLGKMNLSAEGSVGFFNTGSSGFAPNSEFRVDEARLLLDAPIANDVYFFSEINLSARESESLTTQLGELYLDFENVSQLWHKDGQLNIRAGRINIPFGEEYQHRYAMENPLISHSLADFWGIDPGVEFYGALGKFSYALAVQNGGVSGVRDYNADKSVTARIGYTPNKHWHFSVSALRTGELDAANDYASQLWFAEGWFRAIGPGATTFHADLVQGDATARWSSGHVSAYVGLAQVGDNSPTQNTAQDIFYYSLEAQQNLTKKFYVAARFGQIFADKGYPLPGFGNLGEFFGGNNLATSLWRASLGVGYRLSENLLLKTEYSVERGQGAGVARDNEDFLSAVAAFKF